MKTFITATVGMVSLFATGVSLAQNGNMMNGGRWSGDWMGGQDGIWTFVLLGIIVVGLVAWIVSRGRK